jgi:hypothetical protein
MANLTDVINKFIVDADLAHQFVSGGPTDDVVSEGGTYPTLAKIAAEAEARIAGILQLNSLLVAKTFNFTAIDLDVEYRLPIVHNLNTMKYAVVGIRNTDGQTMLASDVIVDANEFYIEFTEPEEGTVTVLFIMS